MGPERVSAQLDLLAEATALLDSASIRHWLMGGWGLDFPLGRISRPHDDVDLFAWGADAVALGDALSRCGYSRKPARHPDESAYFRKYHEWLDITFIAMNDPPNSAGGVRVCGRYSDLSIPADAFFGPSVRFRDVECPVLTASGQLAIKQQFALIAAGESLRPKDEADLAELLRLVRIGA